MSESVLNRAIEPESVLKLNPFGFTRSVVARDHALITPDSHVLGLLPGWEKTNGVILISPQMGARFVQYLAFLERESRSLPMQPKAERFVYVLSGKIVMKLGSPGRVEIEAGGFAYLPPGGGHILSSSIGTARLVVFERIYEPRDGYLPPAPVYGQEQKVEALAFMGDPDARLKTLLPADDMSFDMAVNIFTYQPGATLPNVEVHVMEHGLMMLAGAGVYRLGESYYPVQADDVVWMAPYCPQWFVAMGKMPARYIYYKDVNRDPVNAGGGSR